MARKTVTTSSTDYGSESKTHSTEKTQSQSQTSKVLDEKLLATILGGLQGYMTDEQINAYAENLLKPIVNAEIEASQQSYEATELAKKQEIENLAANLALGIEQQNKAYRQGIANVETAALGRGMGRSSYTLAQLAQQGDALAQAVQNLTDQNDRQSAQIQQQISLAAQQNAQTQGRVNTDYANKLAAKVQELRDSQRQQYNQNYLTAISAAMGQKTEGSSQSEGHSETQTKGWSNTISVTKSSGGGGGKKTALPANNI